MYVLFFIQPIVLVRLEDLTEQQRENVVTVGFTGLNVCWLTLSQ